MFAIICPGRPVQAPLHALTATTFIHALALPLNHIVVFLLPDTQIPDTHAASVHIQFPGQPFRLLGAISAAKPSAIFRVDAKGLQGQVVVGVSIEEVGNVASQLGAGVGVGAGAGAGGAAAGAGVGVGAGKGRVETVVLARRIIQDAFNFLSSFAGGGGGGGEDLVPLRVFNDWWVKFEKKVELDPGFLERED